MYELGRRLAVASAYSVLLATAIWLFPASADFVNYRNLCVSQAVNSIYDAVGYYDPAFTVSCFVFSKLFGDLAIFVVGALFAAAALLLKFLVFRRWPEAFWFILLFYVSRFFFLQEVTQVRAGLAAGLLGVVFIGIVESRRSLAAFAGLLCVVVHLSAVVALPAVVFAAIIKDRFLRAVTSVVVGLAVGVFAGAVAWPPVGSLGLSAIDFLAGRDSRLWYYLQTSGAIDTPIYLNAYLLVKVLLLSLFAVAVNLSSPVKDFIVYRAVVLSSVSLMFSVFFYGNEVLSLRLSELFAVFDAIVLGWVLFAAARGGAAGLVRTSFALLCAVLIGRQALVMV